MFAASKVTLTHFSIYIHIIVSIAALSLSLSSIYTNWQKCGSVRPGLLVGKACVYFAARSEALVWEGMKQSTRLSSAVFQLTPTRTRCDLIIIANDRKEKIASGLLNPFLAHLKTAQDQIDKGGYSILLEPETGSDASWFTKATLKRFVRFVSTPEILERVFTIETEIVHIGEAIALQSCNDIGQSNVESQRGKSLGGYEGGKSVANANDEKAIVLYTPGALPPVANGSCSQEENPKVQLLKVLETRKTALQKEQGMAFARAVAAGFDIDHVAALVSFAECFGALRLMEACSRFIDLWKCKHETGQWLDIEASEALSPQPNFKASGIVLSSPCNNQDDSNHELASEHIGKSGSHNADNPVSNGQQEHFQGQVPHLVYPPWPMHASPGGQPVFQAYPVQGMPYYHPYAGNGPFVQPHHYSLEHSPSNLGSHLGQNRQRPDVRDSNNESEMKETGRTSSLDDTESDEETSQSRRSRKISGGSSKKKSGRVVIRNINFINSKGKKSGSDTNSESHSDMDAESENVDEDVINRSSKRGGSQLRSVDRLNLNHDDVSVMGKNTDDRHWQAFQDCLLRGKDEDADADNEGMFAMEKGVKLKRHANAASDDPLALGAHDEDEMQDNRMKDIHGINGSASRRLRGCGSEVQFASADSDFTESGGRRDIQCSESNGKRILHSTTHEDYMIGNKLSQTNIRNSSDPLALNRYENTNKNDRESSPGMADETLVGPLRSMSLDQDGGTDRNVIDMDSEIPSKYQKSGPEGNKIKVEYEPNDLSMIPERGIDKRSIAYDPALGYEMQVCAELSGKKGGKDVTNVKGGLKKSDKDRRAKVASESLQKQRTGGPLRKAKPSKMNPLEDARARADSLRTYKADLQKMKKEQEEAQRKRLETLKLERQKRIAAKGGTSGVKAFTPSPQAKQLHTKTSPATNRGSKFSDSEPGSSSPLQRSKVRTSVGSGVLNKASKASVLSEGSQKAGNRLIRSATSLSEAKRETNGITPEPKASMSRIRRLSEPKTVTNSPVIAMKARSAEAVLKRKLPEGPERNKVSAIINLDRSKAATLPELKIKTGKLPVNADETISKVKEGQKVIGARPSIAPEKADLNAKICNQTRELDIDENPIVEKTVVVLESEKPSAPTLKSLERKLEVKSSYSEKDAPNFASNSASEQPYRAPHARASSLEDPSTYRAEYGKAPLANSAMPPRAEETLKARVLDVKALKMEINQVHSEKTSTKESSKGLRRLLKFGKKNHTSSVDRSIDSECTTADGSDHDNARKTTSTGEVHTLKNLISQDESSPDGNAPQKTSRHFSLLSPFRIKSSEKKQAS
ncbi:COP1-interacting protein 7-like isoform X2 [Salvia splendens]|uniref:COP1-interacting protein 7-like isoform X2 n=1 Tax=Salvia splendens TaxID=180675 RepID=UPI001C26FAB2|nr:COP1-interacting protein 7-like isoform X2 [Salvia splendens]